MKLYIVVPCYNEEEMLPISSKVLAEKLQMLIASEKISKESRVVFVDDGSKDKTWQIIKELNKSSELFCGIKLSRNKGHQNALLAGLMTVKDECDAAISLDADLQDDVNAIDEMIEKYNSGCDIVYGVRSSRKRDSVFKRSTAHAFYKLMRAMGAEIVYDHADYRLMSRRALDALSEFREVNLFLRGIVPMIGFKSDTVSYERGVRAKGKSKYPLKKMLKFSFEGITSLSIKPIRLIMSLGLLMFLFGVGYLIYSVVAYCLGMTVPGWTSTVVSIWSVGGLQMLSIGIIGEYIGKIYLESKQRPRFIVEEYIKK